MNKLELEFRQHLQKQMSGFWQLTLHENKLVNPGVPDLSFVMFGGECETGWLELKAIKAESHMLKFKVESSQHSWMRLNAGMVPAYFLLSVNSEVFMVPGTLHTMLANPVDRQDLIDVSTAHMHRDRIREFLPSVLSIATTRARNVKSRL